MVQTARNFICIRKSFSELSSEECEKLYATSRVDGAMRVMIKKLEAGGIANPELIYVTMLYSGPDLIGWLLLDKAREYNKLSDAASMMVYVKPDIRKEGIGIALIENDLAHLSEGRLIAYPSKRSEGFFKKAKKRYNLNINFATTVLYF